MDYGIIQVARLGQFAVCHRTQGLPKHSVIEVTPAIESDSIKKLYLTSNIISGNAFSLFLKKVVEVGHICPVVLSVVIVESHSAHNRLKSAHFIG